MIVQPAWADDGMNNRSRREPQFENEHVKAWKTIILPNQPIALHRHDKGRTVIALKGGELKVVDESGKVTNTYHWETGNAYWLDADPQGEMHGDVNETDEPIEVIVVEMKSPPEQAVAPAAQ
jgi:quercetin dioxygenase-like cupin family protein